MKKFSGYFKIFFLILLSLTPVFWFFRRPGTLIDGVDTNFPLDPAIWFHRRFYVWSAVSNAGTDFSASTAGTFFHFLQFLPFKLGFPLQIVELFSLLFWFFMIVSSSWFLSRLFFPKKTIPQLVFVVLYSFNIWLFNSWENVKVANLALAAAIPMGLSLLILLRESKIKRGKAALFSIITGIILAGAGINPAYIICFFLILAIYFLAEVFVDFGRQRLIGERFKDFFVVGIFIVLVNMFWILPSLSFIFGSISSSNSIGVLGFTNWVDSLSENTGFVNILRMQGAWDWYASDSVTGLPLYIPYALNYFFNPAFIAFSFLIPTLAFLAFIFRKTKYSLLYIAFSIMLILGAFLTSGTHQPTGGLFSFFVRHVPFFSLFRSPWYIFAPLIVLSIAGLVSIFFSNIEEKIPKIITQIFGIVFIFGVLVYSYPLLTGKIYRPASSNGFFIKFPSYVFQTRDYLAKTKIDGRILSYPDDNIEKFKWGYSGTDSILNLFSDKEVVFSPLNDTNSPLAKILKDIYLALKRNEVAKVQYLADKLSVAQIFDKLDQDSLSPILPLEILANKVANFGEWSFYNLSKNNPSPKIQIFNCCVLSYPFGDSDENLSILGQKEVLVNPNDSLFSRSNLKGNSTAVIHANNEQFADYSLMITTPSNLKSRLYRRDLSSVKFDFNISENGSYLPILERYKIESFGIINQNKVNLSLDGKDVVWTINHSDDSYLYFEPINISDGNHQIVIQLNNKNLINENNFIKNGNGVLNYSNGIFSMFNLSDKDLSFGFPLSNFDPYGYYLINGSYNHIYGNTAQILVSQGNSKILFKDQTQGFPNYPDWQDFSFYYQPVQSFSDLTVNIVAPLVRDPLGTKVQYRNIAVYKVFDNDLFFKTNREMDKNKANISFDESSPVSYSGRVTGGTSSQVIVFNENYSSNWQLSVNEKQAKIFHFTANSYANAWYIDGAGDNFSFTITYKPQGLLKIGYIITGSVIIVVIIYFIYERKKYGRKN